MKILRLIGAMLVVLGTAIVPMSAQTQSTTVQVSKLVGTTVKSSQGEEIGVIKDVVIDRSTGCMAYTVLSTGEGGGARGAGGGKLVTVPWAVYSPASDVSVLTTTVDRERIYNAPVFDYARIEEYSRPDYITNVYSYYGVSQGAVGVGVSGASTTTGVSGTTTTTGPSGGATGRAGAAGSPAQAGSPAAGTPPPATRSPAERESPAAGRASPTPRAAASPHTRGEATASPSGRRERATRDRPEETESPSSGTREERGTKVRPEDTESQRRGAELQEESPRATRESAREAATPSERTREGTRPHRKPERPESASPPPEPEE